MRRLFLDEAGDFNFKVPQPNRPAGSRLYILTSVAVPDDSTLGGELNDLRHDLALTDTHLQDRVFHATTDFQSTRDAVYRLITSHPVEIHTTIVDKAALPDTAREDVSCYLHIWDRHLKQIGWPQEPTVVTAATLFTGGKYRGQTGVRQAMTRSLSERMAPDQPHELLILPCEADPLLQVADYCCWAIQRWHERDDPRSYEIVADFLHSETFWT